MPEIGCETTSCAWYSELSSGFSIILMVLSCVLVSAGLYLYGRSKRKSKFTGQSSY